MVALHLLYDIIIAISSKLKDTFFWESGLEGATVKHPQLTPWGAESDATLIKQCPMYKGN